MQVFDKDTYLCVGKVADFEAICKDRNLIKLKQMFSDMTIQYKR